MINNVSTSALIIFLCFSFSAIAVGKADSLVSSSSASGNAADESDVNNHRATPDYLRRSYVNKRSSSREQEMVLSLLLSDNNDNNNDNVITEQEDQDYDERNEDNIRRRLKSGKSFKTSNFSFGSASFGSAFKSMKSQKSITMKSQKSITMISQKSDKSSKTSKASRAPSVSIASKSSKASKGSEASRAPSISIGSKSSKGSKSRTRAPTMAPTPAPTMAPIDGTRGAEVPLGRAATSNAKSIEQVEATIISSAAWIGGDVAPSEVRSEEPTKCIDSTDLQYKGNDAKDCAWVGKRRIRKRCRKSWPLQEEENVNDNDKKLLSDYCPYTCGQKDLGPCATVDTIIEV
jgi:hypothetical protein